MLANNAETFELHIPIPPDTRIHKVFKFLTSWLVIHVLSQSLRGTTGTMVSQQ